jgi:hypothetical protein
VLLAGSFDAGTLTLSLTFDREIDVSGIVAGQIVVLDGNQAIEWGGTAEVWQESPASLNMILIENGEYPGSGVWLEAPTGAGIKSADGVAWAGAVDVELPFGG